MTAKRVAVVMGTRPEGVKLAPVVRQLQATGHYEPILISTGQHREMLDQVLTVFELEPDHDLDLLAQGQTLNQVAGRALLQLEPLLSDLALDFLLVQGDTTTAFAGALAGFHLRIPVGHVEAGLRTYDLARPFPEEMNRRLITQVASLHFAPTPSAEANLLAEAVAPAAVFVTGNTVIDTLHVTLAQQVTAGTPEEDNRSLVLITAHRRESWGDGLERLSQALATLAGTFPATRFLFPVHRNPVVRQPFNDRLSKYANVELVEPLPYDRFVRVLARAQLVISDSGGIQEEATALGTPVLVAREKTERPEALATGNVHLVGLEPADIVARAEPVLAGAAPMGERTPGASPFGDGRASERITGALDQFFGFTTERPAPFEFL